MNIEVEKYLSEEEIKDIVSSEIRSHVRSCVGDLSVSVDTGRVFVKKLAKDLAIEKVQELIPNFKELLNEHIVELIKSITLGNLFFEAFGWASAGNKMLKGILVENKELMKEKFVELFDKK